jgi:hypothetical protein
MNCITIQLNTIMNKTHYLTISIDIENTFEKIQYAFMTKNKSKIDRNFINLIKRGLQKFCA